MIFPVQRRGTPGKGHHPPFPDTPSHSDPVTAGTHSTLIGPQGPLRSPFIHNALPSCLPSSNPFFPGSPTHHTALEVLCTHSLLKCPRPEASVGHWPSQPWLGSQWEDWELGPLTPSHRGQCSPCRPGFQTQRLLPSHSISPIHYPFFFVRKSSSRCQPSNRTEKVISNSFLWPSYPQGSAKWMRTRRKVKSEGLHGA